VKPADLLPGLEELGHVAELPEHFADTVATLATAVDRRTRDGQV
jgi:hypothetical protein